MAEITAYRSMHTAHGLQKLAAAEATGVPINLTHMAVGDGNGSDVEPAESQTALVRELVRGPINRVYQHADDPTRYTAELIIPASIGGFTLREVGVFDDSGQLFVVGNLPATHKPHISEGAYADTVVRLEFVASNASIITLLIDPAVAVASQQWVLNAITVCHLLPGGTTGQILKKASNACGDVVWGDPDTASVVVDVIEERQTLATGQTAVILADTTTRGLAVYVEGVRLPHAAGAAGWLEDVSAPDTTVVLGRSYPDGTKIILVQNEPTGAVPFPMVRDNNLTDVPSKSAARTALDVFSRAESRQLAPAGEVAAFARSTAPAGWLKANGAAVSRTAYSDLFAAIGTTFGAGDGFNTFNLPDARAEFIRGLDDGRGIDAGRALGSIQADALRSHEHLAPWVQDAGSSSDVLTSPLYRGTVADNGGFAAGFRDVDTLAAGVTESDDRVMATVSAGGAETRPRNLALLYCIKY